MSASTSPVDRGEHTTWRNGNWEAWQTLGQTNYDVVARPAAVATGGSAFMAVMNGEDARGCTGSFCDTVSDPTATPGEYIQPGGLWIRYFA